MFWFIFIIALFVFWVCYALADSKADELVGAETRKKNNEELGIKRMSNKCVSAKLKNVYKTYQDTTQEPCELCLYDDRLAYVDTFSTIERFSISLNQITSVQCDTFERLTVTRLLTVGVLAFALKKKDYCIIVNYLDDLTGEEEQLLFSTNKKHDVFLNNIIIARNNYRS